MYFMKVYRFSSSQKRLLSTDDVELANNARIIDAKNWSASAKDNIICGKEGKS